MCGIVGIISNDRQDKIKACSEMIAHRGPDDNGIYVEGNLALAHHRLTIIELTKLGHQPMESADGNLVIVFNGEIYNHQEIRAGIGYKYPFRSNSDTETILAGYQIYGTDIFAKLNGIFTIAIYKKSNKKLVIARDPFGVKPLYYYCKNGKLFFSSEIKSFLKIANWDRSLDYKALMNYLHFLYSPGNRTPFLNIKKFPPGHYSEINTAQPLNINFKKYYQIPFNGQRLDITEKDAIERVDSALTNAVERQLLSDVPVGFFLSGGLDSSLIVAKAKEIVGNDIQCFTIANDSKKLNKEGFSNDLDYARSVAKHLDVNLNEVGGGIKIVNEFDNMIWHLDEPQADIAPMHILNICTKAKEFGYKVLLSGAGGDDLFSGYRRHQALNWEPFFKYTPTFFMHSMQYFSSMLPTNYSTFRRIKKILRNATKTPLERMAGYHEWLPLKLNCGLFSDEIKFNIGDYKSSKILIDSLKEIPNENDLLNQMLYWDMKYFLTDHNLNYTDKLSMATGVEVRVPYLDCDLVKLSTNISPSYKLKSNTTKYILKKVAKNYLPDEVIHRKKAGLGGPIREWIKEDLDEMIHEYLAPSKIKERGIFNSDTVWHLINENKTGKIDASYNIWCLLAIESWMRQFIDNS